MVVETWHGSKPFALQKIGINYGIKSVPIANLLNRCSDTLNSGSNSPVFVADNSLLLLKRLFTNKIYNSFLISTSMN